MRGKQQGRTDKDLFMFRNCFDFNIFKNFLFILLHSLFVMETQKQIWYHSIIEGSHSENEWSRR